MHIIYGGTSRSPDIGTDTISGTTNPHRDLDDLDTYRYSAYLRANRVPSLAEQGSRPSSYINSAPWRTFAKLLSHRFGRQALCVNPIL